MLPGPSFYSRVVDNPAHSVYFLLLVRIHSRRSFLCSHPRPVAGRRALLFGLHPPVWAESFTAARQSLTQTFKRPNLLLTCSYGFTNIADASKRFVLRFRCSADGLAKRSWRLISTTRSVFRFASFCARCINHTLTPLNLIIDWARGMAGLFLSSIS